MSILSNWNKLANSQKSIYALIVFILIVACGSLVYLTGGIKFVYAHSMYIPIVLAAIFFKKKGGIIAGITGGIILGPFMPIDTLTGEMQLTVNWIFRMMAFTLVGSFVGHAINILQKTNEELINKVEEQKHREKEVRLLYNVAQDNERILSYIFNASPVIIYRLNLDTYNATWISENINRILGYTVKEALKPNWWEKHLHPEESKKIVRDFSLLSTQDSLDKMYRFIKKNGEVLWIHDRLLLLKDDDGNYSEIIGAWTDITEQKEAEQDRIARFAADQANRAKSAFLSNMSHEIRTPLNAVIGFAQILKRDATMTTKQKEQVQTILRSGEHLLSLINDVLDLSKIEAGYLKLNKGNFSIHCLINDLEMMFRLRAREKGLQFTINLHYGVPEYVIADEDKLRQVFINLLGNAFKFTSTGTVALRIWADSNPNYATDDASNNMYDFILLVEVEDTGPGISEEDKERIFDSFSQAEAGQIAGGTGLGLHISKNLVELMGGKLTVDSQYGKGSKFQFNVPLKSCGKTEEKQIKEHEYVIGLEPGAGPFRIVVADDLQENRDVLRELLEPVGFEIKEAVNGEETLKIFEQWEPHAVLIDMCMPIMDGYEATRRIKEMKKGHSALVIAVTASVLDSDVEKVLAAGTDAYLSKPFLPEELFMILGKLPGLKYVFASNTDQVEDCKILPLTPEDIDILPNKLVQAMCLAVEQGNMAKLKNLIAQVKNINNHTGQGLQILAKQYDYDKLNSLFKMERG